MKKLLILIAPLLLSGCFRYGTGETTGYVYAIDDGLIWDHVWFKSTLEASQADCYLLDNDDLKSKLKEASGKLKVKLGYDRHLFTFSNCDAPESGNATSDEITSIEIL